MIGASIVTEPTFTLGTREPLFDTEQYLTLNTSRRVRLSPLLKRLVPTN